jgi:alpha-tubulin suppressor-like RCC1 family protein
MRILRNLLCLALLAAGCGEELPAGAESEPTGSAELELIDVPQGIQCIVVKASGSSVVTIPVPIGPSTPPVLLLQGLPSGPVSVTGQAFTSACTAIANQTPAWVADPLSTKLVPGAWAHLKLTFRRNQSSGYGEVDFQDSVYQVSVGRRQALAVMVDAKARGWGANELGQLGTGTREPQPHLTPIAVDGLTGLQGISTRNQHSCALFSLGKVKCWGANNFGQVGDGDPSQLRVQPVEPADLANVSIKQVAVGYFHTCAVTGTGALKCWGLNERGQLGLGSSAATVRTPQTVDLGSDDNGPRVAVEVALGMEHTCVRLASGGVMCWGANDHGQLGDGTTQDRRAPGVELPTLHAILAIRAGLRHTCALRADHSVQCWGANGFGQVGDGNSVDRLTPAPVPVTGAIDVAAGEAHSCAVLANGTVKCWGIGEALGNGTGETSLLPVTVDHINRAVAISATRASCALLDNGALECWGANDDGVLGNGTTFPAFVPAPVSF